MKSNNSSQNGGSGQNQGEGDKLSARHYNRQAREFVASGKVDEAAQDARVFVERHPDEAEQAEERAKRGPHRGRGTRVSVDELVAKGRTVVDRVRPMVDRVAAKIRSRLGRNR